MTITQLPTEVGGPITKTELRDRLGDPALVVVDVRPLAAYNGWRLPGRGPRRAHPGRRRLPDAWLRAVDRSEIDRLLPRRASTAERDDRRLRRRPGRAAALRDGSSGPA